MSNLEPSKQCFVIAPIGDDESRTRRATDGVVDAVIIPVMMRLGFDVEIAHRMSDAGSITKQVINKIIDSELVICNLTNLNPNVMYELAVRHAVKKPVITIAENGTRLPFDIQEDRTIFYVDDMRGTTRLAEQLTPMIKSALDDTDLDNPIYRAIESSNIIKSVSTDTEINQYIVDSLEEIQLKISSLERKGSVSFSETLYNKRPTTLIKVEFENPLEDPDIDRITTYFTDKMGTSVRIFWTENSDTIQFVVDDSSQNKVDQILRNYLSHNKIFGPYSIRSTPNVI